MFAAPSDSASISAVFNPIEYTITYNAGEGTQTGSGTTEFTVESDTLVLPGAEREHYDFVGWYDGNNPVTADGFVFPPRDLTLTARYTPHEYVLTYDLNYDGAADETDTFTLLDYETFALKDAPDVMRPGDWYFDGWYTSADGRRSGHLNLGAYRYDRVRALDGRLYRDLYGRRRDRFHRAGQIGRTGVGAGRPAEERTHVRRLDAGWAVVRFCGGGYGEHNAHGRVYAHRVYGDVCHRRDGNGG